jgi:hypothetical protein
MASVNLVVRGQLDLPPIMLRCSTLPRLHAAPWWGVDEGNLAGRRAAASVFAAGDMAPYYVQG